MKIVNYDRVGSLPGSMVFIGGYTLTSIPIRTYLWAKYSHVGVYVGNGEMIEADFGGVQKTKMERYEKSWLYYGELVTPGFILENPEKIPMIVAALNGLVGKNYDYGINVGTIISWLFKFSRSNEALFDCANAFRCSEAVAYVYKMVGESFKIPVSQVTPKDLYLKYKEK